MDFYSISVFISNFAFFIFLWVGFFCLRNLTTHKSLGLLLLSSGFMTISLLAFHFEFRLIVSGSNYAFIMSFFSFSSLMSAIFLIALMIAQLYGEVIPIKKNHMYTYAILAGGIYSFNTIYGTYLLGFIFLFLLMIYPGYHLGKALFSTKVDLKRTPFVYQLGLLSIFYVLKMINLFQNPDISPLNPNNVDTVITMFILLIMNMFYVTYLLEYNHVLNVKLQSKSSLLSQSLNEVKLESQKDALTRIPNRGKLNDMLEVYFESYIDAGSTFSIAMIDVNNFKDVNDVHGHSVGDKVLKEIATNLQEVIRSKDIVGRWGGDEFMVIFPNTTKEHLEVLKSNLKNGFDSISLSLQNKTLSLSIGIANAYECESILSLIDLADKRMYEDKDIHKKTIQKTITI